MSLKPIKRSRRRANRHPRFETGGNWNFHWQPKKFDPVKHKRMLLGTFILSVLAFGILWSQDPNNSLFHTQCSHHPSPPGMSDCDPSQIIWHPTAPTADLSEFNIYAGSGSAVYHSHGPLTSQCMDSAVTGPPCIRITPGNTTVVALSKSAVGDLSIASKNILQFGVPWSAVGTPTVGDDFGFFLTTNKTLPQSASYNPVDDPSVVFAEQYFLSGATTISNNVLMLRTLAQGHTLRGENPNVNCSPSGSAIFCQSETFSTNSWTTNTYLNFTGITNTTPCSVTQSGPNIAVGGSGCSLNLFDRTTFADAGAANETTNYPWIQSQTTQYYAGFYVTVAVGTTIIFYFDVPTGFNGTEIAAASFVNFGPVVDTGGVFGPVIKALINIGVFIFNGVLAFISFVTPALQAALNFLESIMVSALNGLGNALGLGNVGTDLANLLNSLITFFANGSFANIFTNLPTIFSRLIDTLTIYFPWLPNAIAIGLNIATFMINGIGFVLTVFADATLIGIGVAVTLLIVLFFVYTGDNSLGGVLEFWETAEWLVVGLGLKFLAYLVNFVLDVVTALIGVIPKPFVQMVAHALPRIPIVEVDARFTYPSGSMSEISNGNLFAVALWVSGLLFVDLFESASPALPGSIGALIPAAAAPLVALKGLTSLLALMTVFVWIAAIFVVPIGWFSNAMDLGINLPFESSLGNRPSSHLGIRVRKGEKHNVAESGRRLIAIFRRQKKEQEPSQEGVG